MIRILDRKEGKIVFKVKNVFVSADSSKEKPFALLTAYMIDEGIKKALISYEGKYFLVSIEGRKVRVEEVDLGEENPERYAELISTEENVVYIETPRFSQWEKKYAVKDIKKKVVIYSILFLSAFSFLGFLYKKRQEEIERRRLEMERNIVRQVPLPPDIKEKLYLSAGYIILQDAVRRINSLRNGIRLKNYVAEVKTRKVQKRKNLIVEEVVALIKVSYESVYPIPKSYKAGKYFVRQEQQERKIDLAPSPFRSKEECGLFLLEKGVELISYDRNLFRGIIKEWENVKESLEFLQGCGMIVRSFSLNEKGMSLEVELR